MKKVKKILCLLLAFVLVGGTVLPNIKAKAENVGAVANTTFKRMEVYFEGAFTEGDITTFPEADELNNWTNIEGYDLHNLNPIVSVYYEGVDEPEVYNGWDALRTEMMPKFGAMPTFRTYQDKTPYKVGSDNKVEMYFSNQFQCETTVRVEDSPIQSVEVITGKPLYEIKDMITLYDRLEDDTQVSFKGYSVGMTISQVIVTDRDGNEYEFQYLDDMEAMFGASHEISTDQGYYNQWKPGKHTATFMFLGKTCEFEVEVKEYPIQSIEAKYYGLVMDGVTTELDHTKLEFFFTFKDGTEESYYYYDTVLGESLQPDFIKCIPENQTILEGKQYWCADIWGQEVILETDLINEANNPIKEISAIATNDLVAGWHWGFDWVQGIEVIQPICAKPEVTLTYQDGSQVTMSYNELQKNYSNAEPKLTLPDNSLEGIGKRTAILEFYGRTCTFDVNVIENPVERISAVATKPLVEGFRGEFYNLTFDGGVIITVYYKDGRTFSGTVDEMNNMFYAYPDEEDKQVVIGKNVKEYTFLGKTCDVEFEVVPDNNPVVAMEAEVRDGAVLYQNQDLYNGAYYRCDHLIDVTLTYKDGTKLTGSMDEVNELLDRKMKVVDEVWVGHGQNEEPWGLGEHTCFVRYRGFEIALQVKVVENPYVKATISKEDNFTVVLERKDGQIEIYKAKKYVAGGSYGRSWNLHGYLETDQGVLPIETKFAGGMRSDYTDIIYMSIHGVRSNSLQNCTWIEQQTIAKAYGDVPEVQLNNSAEELRELVLTQKEQDELYGENLKAWLEISEKEGELSADEKNLLNQATSEMNGYQNGVVVDLSVYKQFPDIEENQKKKVSNLNDKISITMQVPEDVLASTTDPSTIKMVRIHNGETQVLPCVYDAATKTITFETDKFSTYAMAYEAPASPGGNGSSGGESDSVKPQPSGSESDKAQDNKIDSSKGDNVTAQSSPQTGDNHTIVLYILLCAVSLMTLVIGKKKAY